MRRLAAISLMIAVWIGAALPAVAGGAVWEFERYQRPGDQVLATTAVSWDHDSSLGTPDQGPYFVYLAPMDVEYTIPVLEEALLVGLVEVYEGQQLDSSGRFPAPHRAVARFEIPDVEPGVYQILHCNDPCTNTLGDIIGGWDLRILSGSEGRPAEVIAAEVREASKGLPLLHREDPPAGEVWVAEPAPTSVARSEADPIRVEAPPRGSVSSSEQGPVVNKDSESLADALTVALVVSVAAMVWVGWSRAPEKAKKEVLG